MLSCPLSLTVLRRIVLGCLFCLAWFVPFQGSAFFQLSSVPVTGYAWSSTIGWVALSGPSHQVTINTDGTVTGYAWSSHIGWVRFGGLSGFPTGGGTFAQNAQLVETSVGSLNYQLRGWARACAGTADIGNCSGGAHPTAGGWDGWIALSGDAHTITFSAAGPTVNSFAWGSDVVGWVDFYSHVGIGDVTTPFSVTWNRETYGDHVPNREPMRDWVQFSVAVTGGPATGTIPFSLSIDGHADSITGIFDLATNQPTQPLRLDDVLAGVEQMVRLTIGGTEFTDRFTLPVEQPNIRIVPSQALLRQGDTASVFVRIDPDYFELSCQLTGAGLNQSFTSTYGGGVYESPTYTTGTVRNQTRITATCIDLVNPNTPVYSTFIDMRVIPNYQEF